MKENGDIILWSPGVSLEQIEKQVILKAYSFYRQNKTATSNALGIAIRTLDSKLEKYELEEKEVERKTLDERKQRAAFLERSRGSVPQDSPYLTSADARLRMESSPNFRPEHPVPMSEPVKVQAVLPAQTAKSGAKKGS